MIYRARFYNQTGQGEKHSIKVFLFTDCVANDNPIGYCDNLGKDNQNLIWFELFEYSPDKKMFSLLPFFCGMNF
ncbi:MAG: hypothetical protein IPJ03_15845 [Ignavibacteriales bacterium]|nr:hypothetical protein [Ignavibacteriales bacterium]